MATKQITALFFILLLIAQSKASSSEDKQEKIQECLRKSLADAALAGTFTTFSSFILAKLSLWMMGFSSIGPVAGSLAAWMQSILGNVVAGSIFSTFQSLAMGKLSLLLGPSVVGGVVVAFSYWIINCIPISFFFDDDNENSKNQDGGWFNWTVDSLKYPYKLLKAIYSKKDQVMEIILYAIDLLKKEYQKYQEGFYAKAMRDMQLCYEEQQTPNTLIDFYLGQFE